MRILILSAGAGAGHNRAADALDKACKLHFSSIESKWEDVLNYSPRLFRVVYADSYSFLSNRTPIIWGILYQVTDKKEKENSVDLSKVINQFAYNRIMKMVNDYKPDVVICTHFLPANVLLKPRGGKVPKLPVYVIVTDYTAHPLWLNRDATGYFVASEELKWLLMKRNYPGHKITITGIPIDPPFYQNSHNIQQLRTTLNLRNDTPVILFTMGGHGANLMKDGLMNILRINKKFQLVVIAGKNKRIQTEMEQIAAKDNRVHIRGFITNMQDYMRASDFVISRAGGQTVTEALAANLPMIIFSPIPGQEEANTDFILESGVAVKAPSLDVLDYKIRTLLDHPERLKTMRQEIGKIYIPESGRKIIEHAVEHINGK